MKPLFSLLWPHVPPGQHSPDIRLGTGASADLELNEIVQALTGGEGTRVVLRDERPDGTRHRPEGDCLPTGGDRGLARGPSPPRAPR